MYHSEYLSLDSITHKRIIIVVIALFDFTREEKKSTPVYFSATLIGFNRIHLN